MPIVVTSGFLATLYLERVSEAERHQRLGLNIRLESAAGLASDRNAGLVNIGVFALSCVLLDPGKRLVHQLGVAAQSAKLPAGEDRGSFLGSFLRELARCSISELWETACSAFSAEAWKTS